MPVPTAQQKIRFGAFELDRETAELYKNGTKLKLQGQPIAVLALLLERPGELVTREELRKHLWPEDTFVDFENSLNTHIKKLRQVFDDDPETPRYIEALPRRGYRFIAQVAVATNGSVVAAPEPAAPKPHRWKYLIVALAACTLLGGLLYLFVPRFVGHCRRDGLAMVRVDGWISYGRPLRRIRSRNRRSERSGSKAGDRSTSASKRSS